MTSPPSPNPKPQRRPTFMKAWRQSRGWTQPDLQEALALLADFHMDVSQLSRIERGEQEYRQDLLEALATVYSCDPSDVIRRDPRIPDAPRTIIEGLEDLKPGDQDVVVRMIEGLRNATKATGTDG